MTGAAQAAQRTAAKGTAGKGTAPPRVLVVILNYRTPELTLRAAAAALADLPGPQSEIVLVDNASGDGSDDRLRQAIAARGWSGRVRLIVSPVNGGFGAGNNIGFRAGMADGSAPDFFYVLNSDAFPDPGCLPALIAHLQSHPSAGMVGSHVRGEDGVAHHTAFRFPGPAGEFEATARLGLVTRLLRRRRVPLDLPAHPRQVDWVAGASLLIRAEMLHEIGPFDERFFLYFEETDLCRRTARAGWQVWYQPEARLVHIGSVSTGMKTWRRRPTYWYASHEHYHRKHHGARGYWAAVAAQGTGDLLHRLRCALGGRAPQEPRHLNDLLRHAFRLRRAPDRAAIRSAGASDAQERKKPT